MDGVLNPGFPIGGYQPVHKGIGGYEEVGTTPNFEIMEGIRFGQFYPAPYLPEVRFENVFKDSIVIPAGCPVALDANGFLVPAGYKLANEAVNEVIYSQKDIDFFARFGIKAYAVAPAVPPAIALADNPKLMGGPVTGIGPVIGVASYDVFRIAGKDPQDPGTFYYHNYQRQNGVAVLTDYLLEFPIEPIKRELVTITAAGTGVEGQLVDSGETTADVYSVTVKIDGNTVYPGSYILVNDGDLTPVPPPGVPSVVSATDQIYFPYPIPTTSTITVSFEDQMPAASGWNAVLRGMSTFRGPVTYADLITFDGNSKYKAISAAAITAPQLTQVMGKVTLIDKKGWPKQMLDKVRTAHDPRLGFPIVNPETLAPGTSKMDQQAGSATGGIAHNQWMAGQTRTVISEDNGGIVRFNMNI